MKIKNINNFEEHELELLKVLMNKDDVRLVISLKGKKNVTRDELTTLGDIILTNLRRYC